MGRCTTLITAAEEEIRNQSLDRICSGLTLDELLHECEELDRFRRRSTNLYERVRALFFLYAVHRFHLPGKTGIHSQSVIPYAGVLHLLNRRFQEAIEVFLSALHEAGPSDALSSALAEVYRGLAFQTLADQVRNSVRSTLGNRWMFRMGHPSDCPLTVRRELLVPSPQSGLYPVLMESTPVRMDLTHCCWSDIFFLGMDYPEGARVINISVDLSILPADRSTGAAPRPPITTALRIIDRPVLRLTSVDLEATADLTELPQVFDFAADYLGLLKAAVIASGLVAPGLEGACVPLAELLGRLCGPGRGIEIVSHVNGIPKGSRLAVSTNLLGSLIALCMRATGQIASLTGGLEESERRTVAARAILGEWLGGSGGGWQDSGGIWPGIKLISGEEAVESDPEWKISRGRLLPRHRVLTLQEVPESSRRTLQESLVLVHGGISQDVGPVLEMVTEKYLLRSEEEWAARLECTRLLDRIQRALALGDTKEIGALTQANFDGPIRTIIPAANNLFTQTLIDRLRVSFGDDFYGFWMLGGISGGGMGFLFRPTRKAEAQVWLRITMNNLKRELENALPFAMDPVVYDFSINEHGSRALLREHTLALMPPPYYALIMPQLVRQPPESLTAGRRREMEVFSQSCRHDPEQAPVMQALIDRLLPDLVRSASEGQSTSVEALLEKLGFDQGQHEQVRHDLEKGRIGLAENRLPAHSTIEDVLESDLMDGRTEISASVKRLGENELALGRVAVVTLAGGAGSRWTSGAGVVKSINPFCSLGGEHRTFLEIHLAKSGQTGVHCGISPPHIITTSHLTHQAIHSFLENRQYYRYPGTHLLSPGQAIGLRMIPMVRDLRFAWEEMPVQQLDEQAQKVQLSHQRALLEWAVRQGEGADYRDNLPAQCIHPVGHWYEIPNLFLNGTLSRLLELHPAVNHLFLHNIDTLGVHLDPGLLGLHLQSGAAMTCEVISRRLEDRGGGLARVDGQLRLLEGMALPREEDEFRLSWYNSASMWIGIDPLLAVFGLVRTQLADRRVVENAVRRLSSRMPTYITIKEVKKRWGNGQEDVYPVSQFEKLWGDMTALPEFSCSYLIVPRQRGQQLKDPSQLDGWLRDGSADHVRNLCGW